MAHLFPFQAYRYSSAVAGDPALAVTQPYDKISPEMRKEYYRRSLYNVVRLTKGLEQLDNPDTNYPEAARALQAWIDQGALVQDALPSIYAYYLQYDFEGEHLLRKGFVSLLDLLRSAAGVLPHEGTLASSKLDRLRLLRSTECNEDMIFMIYTEDKLKVNRILEEATSRRAPELKVKDEFGVVHRLWSLSDPKTIRQIQDAMVPEELFIADGHHRYEAALGYKKECEALGWKPACAESFHHRVVACFNSADGGITILPTHRVIVNVPGFDRRAFLGAAEKYFEAESCPNASELWQRMETSRDSSHAFGFYTKGKFTLLRLRRESAVVPLMMAHAEAYRKLDVSILHHVILARLLGIREDLAAEQDQVEFAREREACVHRVDAGAARAAFFLNPTTVEQVQRIALLGERMPLRSTDFYPKLLSGLAFMKMRIVKPANQQS